MTGRACAVGRPVAAARPASGLRLKCCEVQRQTCGLAPPSCGSAGRAWAAAPAAVSYTGFDGCACVCPGLRVARVRVCFCMHAGALACSVLLLCLCRARGGRRLAPVRRRAAAVAGAICRAAGPGPSSCGISRAVLRCAVPRAGLRGGPAACRRPAASRARRLGCWGRGGEGLWWAQR